MQGIDFAIVSTVREGRGAGVGAGGANAVISLKGGAIADETGDRERNAAFQRVSTVLLAGL